MQGWRIAEEAPEPSRLARRLGLLDAVVVGLGSMIGAGVFAAVGPAAGAAGSGLLVGLAVAGAVAYCNATSSAELAAAHPWSGGTYVYGRELLGPFWGWLAGWCFVVGKLASCAAIALTFGAYCSPALRRPVAVGAVVVLTAVNYHGIRRTAAVTRAIVVVVLGCLAAFVATTLAGGGPSAGRLGSLTAGGVAGVLEAAGLMFFAFAGYARIATLGEEVVDPARTIPRAIPLALGIALAVYGGVSAAALLAVGPAALAASPAPLASAAGAVSGGWLVTAVRLGALLATLGVLLSLLAAVSRTAFAMAANRDLPRGLAAVHPAHRVPHRAQVAAGAVVAALVLVGDLRGVIGFSSFAVLAYYALTNAAAWSLPAEARRWPRGLAVAGAAGCGVLAFSLPAASIAGGVAVLAAGAGAGAWYLRAASAR